MRLQTRASILADQPWKLVKTLTTPKVAEKLSAQGMDIIGREPDAFQTPVKAEIARWSKVTRDNKIKAGE